METFECVSCLGTYTGTWIEASELKWRRHQFGALSDRESVLCCGECEAKFAERRKVKAQFNALMVDAGLVDAA